MKIKIQKRKFIRNICIGIIALILVALIINIAPGYKKNKYINVINLVIMDENVTEKLKKPVYQDEEGGIYISKEDIQQFLDKTIYYDENEDLIISTSDVAVASMKVGELSINKDGSDHDTLYTAIKADDTIYIPIKEMEMVYNIDVIFLEDEKMVIIDKLNQGMIKTEVDSKAKIKFKPRALSKNIGTVNVGDSVSAFYTTSKGWRLIRTEDGIIGYVKANVLTNEYILRQDMDQSPETQRITINVEDNANVNINNENIIIKDLLKLTNEGVLIRNIDIDNNEDFKIWANLRLEEANISNYSSREKSIKNIESIARKNGIKGINVIINNNDENLERFVIELAPKLREMGIITNIVLSDNINNISEEKYTNIVNYIITTVN